MLADFSAPVVCDVGANIGDVTTRLAAAFPPFARIVAVEPAGEVFPRLRPNTELHSHGQAFQLAFGCYHGDLLGTRLLYGNVLFIRPAAIPAFAP